MYAKTGFVFRIEAAVAGDHVTPMISIWRAERRTASAQRGDGGVDAVSPGPRPGAGWWHVGFIGLGLAIPVVSPAQVQYRDRNGQTWTAPNQIERQIREDINARSNANSGYVRVGPSLEQELAAQRSQDLAWEEGQRRMHEQNNRRNEELKREMAWQAQAEALRDLARREAKLKADKETQLRAVTEQRRIVAEILQKADEGPGVLKASTWSPWLVAALAEGLITGKFHGLSLAEVGGVYGSVRERFGLAQRLFREADGFEGRRENRNHEGSAGAYGFDFISRAASVLRGSRTFVDSEANHWEWSQDIFSEWERILVHLCMTLAMPESRLNPEQREQAARLVADAMGRVSLEGDDGAAFACIVVTAARRCPELRRIPMLHEKVIPVARRSVWAYGIESWPSPEKEAVPLIANPTTGLYWNLAAMLCLGSDRETPLQWFAMLRDQRRAAHLAPATATELVRVQQGLEGWFARRRFSAAVRQAIQADCDLACRASEAELAATTTWDATLRPFRGKLPSDEEMAAVGAALSNPASLRQAGARSSFAISRLKRSPRTDASIDGLVYTYLGKASAKGPDHATRVLTALRWVTDLDDAVSFRGIPREKWETLVKLGENFCAVRDPQWTDPSVNARLARVRSERIGDEAGARQWLAAPGRQPNDGDTPEKWREWATLAGRPGLVVAASRHPEHWTEPALLRRALNGIAGNVVDVVSPTARSAVKALLARTESVTDPETVLLMAQLRGPLLGDWARLGAWLDDPRRRPKGPDDPLYPVFFKAIIERDQAAGYLSDNWFASAKNAGACARLEKWLEQVLAAKGEVRKKLIDENFPAVIYCEDAASAYPDLRMLGYDAARGGFASRALLLLSTAEFNPENLLVAGVSEITLDDGTVLRTSLYDVEPWLQAVAKLPRAVPADVLLAEMTAGVQARLDWRAKLAALPRREVFPGLSKEENDKLGAAESPAYQALVEDGRRSGWVGGGCQQALARLAERWSPVRESAQAAILARGDQLLLDQNDLLVHAPSIAARVKWEQGKMRGLDDADAFVVASAGLSGKELRLLAKLAGEAGWLRPLVLWQDEGFVSAAKAAAAVATR
ncbi:hypothetical protein [Horticoccus sp. 23ND18S-11]|uniref:hypothetical protein n=1 Tax=Horticoccus sp. 23ND18S-11 TaxID=3391832 RepID=UPI0039C98370